MNMDDGKIFQYFIQRCSGKTTYSVMVFSRVMPLCDETSSNRAKYKVVYLPFELHVWNYEGNHISVYEYGRREYLPIFHSKVVW